MLSVININSALPKYHSDNSSINSAAKKWLHNLQEKYALFQRFLASSKTENRYFIMPPDEVVTQNSLQMRSELFERHAPQLAIHALKSALMESGLKANEIDAIIFSSCSCPLIPAADTYVIAALGLRPDVVRIPTYQFGCAGGVAGLGIAYRLSNSAKNIVVLSAEICSLVFQPTNTSASALVGAALFGDGACAAILSSNQSSGLHIIDHLSYLIPESRYLMGYDILDSGSHLRLDKDLPAQLARFFPEILSAFLNKHSLTINDIPWWLFHPGSSKIVTRFEELLGLKQSQAIWSHETLRSVGNLSSATILFVMERFLRSNTAKKGDYVVVAGIGPGLTIELVLCLQK